MILQKQNSMPLGILRRVYKIHFSQISKMCPSIGVYNVKNVTSKRENTILKNLLNWVSLEAS